MELDDSKYVGICRILAPWEPLIVFSTNHTCCHYYAGIATSRELMIRTHALQSNSFVTCSKMFEECQELFFGLDMGKHSPQYPSHIQYAKHHVP